jgi:biotin transport system substrate-specific component
MNTHALVPALWENSEIRPSIKNAITVAGGVGLIAMLAQVAIPLPFTPVPITGQTFGVAIVGLGMGRRLGVSTLLAYLLLGAVGLPIFAEGRAGVVYGPTLGYLVGMLASSAIVGTLADRGWAKRFSTAWTACALGSAAIFVCGLTWLSLFIPADTLLVAGFLPFIPGDLIKTTLAASVMSTFVGASTRRGQSK